MIEKNYHLADLYQFYQSYTLKHTHHVCMDKDAFASQIIHHKDIWVSYDGPETINGFISICKVDDMAYITLLYGSKPIKSDLLDHMEADLCKQGVKDIRWHFFNPVKIPFYPLKDVIHPAVQGVLKDSEDHGLLIEHAYEEHSLQHTYYQALKDFSIDDYDIDHLDHIDFYDDHHHENLVEFAEEIGVESWKQTILFNLKRLHPRPLLVALDKKKVIGFTGPIMTEDHGRGYFAGIGLLKSYRGKGLGKALFFKLCQSLKDIDAQYMTFFTGHDNPARYIYESAGFKVVQSFVTMKKHIGGH